jgi:hypothetical protein
MSVDQINTIDVISTSPNGKVVLSISDHLSWSEEFHLQLLLDKINSYLQFIETGQIFIEYPNAVGCELVIETVMKFEPSEEGTAFLTKAKEVVNNAGIGFQWRTS